MHQDLAWVYLAVLFIGVPALVFFRYRHVRRARGRSVGTPGRIDGAPRGPQDAETRRRSDTEIYDVVEPYARLVKAILQMIIAVTAIGIVGWQFLHVWPASTAVATTRLLDGIGVGLAAAAVVELAYTLFTAGPDEALDPLMLGLSAALLIELGKPDAMSASRAVALLLLGLLLAVLFAARLFLAERHDKDERPNIWWLPGGRDAASQPADDPPLADAGPLTARQRTGDKDVRLP